jgi:hypothetical protein
MPSNSKFEALKKSCTFLKNIQTLSFRSGPSALQSKLKGAGRPSTWPWFDVALNYGTRLQIPCKVLDRPLPEAAERAEPISKNHRKGTSKLDSNQHLRLFWFCRRTMLSGNGRQ